MLELLQNLTIPQMLMIAAGAYLVYHFFLKKSPVTVLPTNTVATVPQLTNSETTRKINNALNPLEASVLVRVEQKKVVGLVAEWADLREAAVANGASEAVKKLDEMFPLLNKPEAQVSVVPTKPFATI